MGEEPTVGDWLDFIWPRKGIGEGTFGHCGRIVRANKSVFTVQDPCSESNVRVPRAKALGWWPGNYRKRNPARRIPLEVIR